ncbi:MAG: 30S ribosomal protein S16 [Hydrogenobaculum sp.]|nr:MAG: 30S ribosomal protein S16 [Hydrogenobaculum sp.]PMP90005.1 MAG: 30S ribosomal protein S16 [Hydrogenobaculum sp.]HEK25277.1 30S ribosomal protein S16 [Hydrogenobaculum sp.]
MVKIRLARFGRTHHPIYRIVAMDSKSPREGHYLDILGTYDPKSGNVINLNKEAIDQWIKKGAQLSDRVKAILKQANANVNANS